MSALIVATYRSEQRETGLDQRFMSHQDNSEYWHGVMVDRDNHRNSIRQKLCAFLPSHFPATLWHLPLNRDGKSDEQHSTSSDTRKILSCKYCAQRKHKGALHQCHHVGLASSPTLSNFVIKKMESKDLQLWKRRGPIRRC